MKKLITAALLSAVAIESQAILISEHWESKVTYASNAIGANVGDVINWSFTYDNQGTRFNSVLFGTTPTTSCTSLDTSPGCDYVYSASEWAIFSDISDYEASEFEKIIDDTVAWKSGTLAPYSGRTQRLSRLEHTDGTSYVDFTNETQNVFLRDSGYNYAEFYWYDDQGAINISKIEFDSTIVGYTVVKTARVSEPGSFALLGLGLAGFGLARKKIAKR